MTILRRLVWLPSALNLSPLRASVWTAVPCKAVCGRPSVRGSVRSDVTGYWRSCFSVTGGRCWSSLVLGAALGGWLAWVVLLVLAEATQGRRIDPAL